MFNATMDEKQFVSVLNGNIATSLKSSPVYSYFKLQDASKPSTGMGVE
jgi:hypothetical protein